ncbi:unnamed protein product, partial [Polarella glacialis]
ESGSVVVGCAVVDLQDRLLSEALQQASKLSERPRETRTLWSSQSTSLLPVGSVCLWLQVLPTDDERCHERCHDAAPGRAPLLQEEEEVASWPRQPTTSPVELRLVLKEARPNSSGRAYQQGAAGTSAVIASLALELPVQRLADGGQPLPQFSDARPVIPGKAISFQWRAVFSEIAAPASEVWVVVSFFELGTGRLLGRGRRCLEGLISNAASKNQRAYKFPLNSVDVLGANGLSWGCFDMSASAMPQDLANQYPVKFGRDAGPVPTDNMATREEYHG